ncbi:DUF3932 family protein [Bacillus sp. GB_SG_008]|uniref:DUF3932 family protein n=1 Tax=Bacillus sp. GB_SG_008 TaxID=3454627 RepID=UPI003F842460
MKELFRLQTDFSSSFDRWVSSFISETPAELQWSTLKELIHEYIALHTIQAVPEYISSSITYYAQRISTPTNTDIVIYESPSMS